MKTLTFFGTGSSTGIPVISCNCPVCRSDDPRDKRYRITAHLESETTSILIDVSPDIRQQAIENKLERIDGILMTHAHYDHVSGIDELRIYNFLQQGPITTYGNENTLNDIRTRFPYIFIPTQEGGGKPALDLSPLKSYEPIMIGDFKITPLPVIHGKMEIFGYLVDDRLAFITDCSRIPEQTMERLTGLHTIILDAVRIKPHPTHFSFDEAYETIEKCKPERGYFIHMNHDIGHQELEKKYGPLVTIPHDGLRIEI